MRKTILVVTDNLRSQINGVVTTFNNIEIQARKNNHKVVYLDPSLFPSIACPGYPEVRLAWPYGISRKIKAINPDFIHIATEGPVGLFARWWCERNCIQYNTSYHTDFPKFLKAMYNIPAFITMAYIRWFHKNSYRVLVTTESIKKQLSKAGFNNLVVWSRGVDFTMRSNVLRFKQTSGKKTILYVGRISKEKRLDDLITLQQKYNLVVVGDGPYRKELQQKLPHATFLGYLQGRKLFDQYALADVFVFPSKSDTFGVVIIEALSEGTPVAAYPVEGPIDIIKNNITGYLSNDLEFAIEQCLLLDRKVIKEMSLEWTWDRCWQIFQNNLVKINRTQI